MPKQPPMHDIELDLSDLGHRIAWPPAPRLAERVQAEIPTIRRRRFPRRTGSSGFTLAAAAVALVLVATLALLPSTRDAVASLLGVPGIRIEFGTHSDEVPAAGSELLLGKPVSLGEAAELVAFDIQVPQAATLGAPDEIYVREVVAGPMVSLLWHARSGLPAAAETGVGALLMEFQTEDHPGSLIKRLAAGGEPELVQIGDASGFWISDASVLMIAQDPSVGFRPAESRPSANVLVWQRDGVTFRLETALSHDAAIRLAESLEPAG